MRSTNISVSLSYSNVFICYEHFFTSVQNGINLSVSRQLMAFSVVSQCIFEKKACILLELHFMFSQMVLVTIPCIKVSISYDRLIKFV